MRKTALSVVFVLLTAVLLGQNILLWDNDNYSSFVEPGGDFYVGCEFALGRALINNGFNYNEVTILPENLNQYDAVFVTLGIYCFS
jgi:hypothetical protein